MEKKMEMKWKLGLYRGYIVLYSWDSTNFQIAADKPSWKTGCYPCPLLQPIQQQEVPTILNILKHPPGITFWAVRGRYEGLYGVQRITVLLGKSCDFFKRRPCNAHDASFVVPGSFRTCSCLKQRTLICADARATGFGVEKSLGSSKAPNPAPGTKHA